MHRRMNKNHCGVIGKVDAEGLKLEKRRSQFILRNKFRNIAGNNRLGVLWVVLEPLVMSVVYLFVLTVLRSNLSPESIFVGITLFGVVTTSIMSGVDAIGDYTGGLRCERIRTRVLIIPMIKYRVIDAICRSFPVALLLLLVWGSPPIGCIFFMLSSMILAVSCEGFALNFSRMIHHIADLKIVIRYILRLMFFTSPVLYPLSMADGIHLQLNLINPFTYYSESTRFILGLDSGYDYFETLTFSITVGASLLLAFRGFYKIDDLRWELSSWS